MVFSRKTSESHHPLLMNNNVPVKRVPFHKYLGLTLGSIVYFNSHINNVLSKIIVLLRKFQYILPRRTLITIYKTFVTPHLDVGDFVYDKVFNESFHRNA